MTDSRRILLTLLRGHMLSTLKEPKTKHSAFANGSNNGMGVGQKASQMDQK
jgi:hypothetical protein